MSNKPAITGKLKQFVAEWVKGAEKVWRDMHQKCIELEAACQEFGQKDVYSEITRQYPALTEVYLDRMRSVGQGKMPERLLWAGALPAADYLEKLPCADAEKLMSDKIPVLMPDESGAKSEILYKNYTDLTAFQCKQVFGDKALRSIEQQREWLLENRLRYIRSAKPKENFVLIGEYVEITGPLKMKLTEVKHWCSTLIKAAEKALGAS